MYQRKSSNYEKISNFIKSFKILKKNYRILRKFSRLFINILYNVKNFQFLLNFVQNCTIPNKIFGFFYFSKKILISKNLKKFYSFSNSKIIFQA